MRWEDERYVRVYVRDTVDSVALGWKARALFVEIMRKADRTGALELGRSGQRGLAALTGIPESVVAEELPRLIEDGRVEQHGTILLLPNFIEAQEASMSPGFRQKESRERRRDQLRAGMDPKLRRSVIYFIQSEHGGSIKIGQADDVARRLQGLQTGRPDRLVLLSAFIATVSDERRLHEALSKHRDKGEWFYPHPDVMTAVAAASLPTATIADVLGSICHETSTVTKERVDVSSHETSTVTPYRTVPSRTVQKNVGEGAGAPPGGEPPDPPDGPPGGERDPDLGTGEQSQTVLTLDGTPGGAEVAPRRDIPAEVYAAYLDGWTRYVGKGAPPTLDSKRRKLILARSKDFTPEQLCQAARGAWASAWHREEHGKRMRLDQVYANTGRVEQFIAAATPAPIRTSDNGGYGRVIDLPAPARYVPKVEPMTPKFPNLFGLPGTSPPVPRAQRQGGTS